MRVTSKGQVTIPRDLRELVGIEPNSEVVFTVENGKLTLAPKDNRHSDADRTRLAALDAFPLATWDKVKAIILQQR